MAARGLFVNFSLSDVQAIQAKATELILQGKTIMSYGDQGTSVSKQFPMEIDMVLEEVNYALRELDPDEYGSNRELRRAHSNYGGTTMNL